MKLVKLIWLLVALHLRVVWCTSDANSSTNICTAKNQPNFEFNLLSSMLFTKYLLLIDSNYLVYEIPRTGINTYGRLVLNISGVPLEQYWPAFKDNAKWAALKPLYKSIYHLIDTDGSAYVYIDAFPCPDGHVCIRYDMQKKEIQSGWGYDGTHREQVIMADHMERVYTIKNYGHVPPIIYTWKFTSTRGKTDYKSTGRLYYLVNEKDPSDRNVTVLYGEQIYSPTRNPLVKHPRFKGYRLENLTTDWGMATRQHLPVGFLYKGHFNLYSFKKAIFFADALPSYEQLVAGINANKYRDGTMLLNTKLTDVPVSKYIQCASDVTLATWPPTEAFQAITFKPQASYLIWILLIIGLLLLAILVACIVYFGYFSKKSRHRKKGKKKSKDKRASSANRKLSKGSAAGKESLKGRQSLVKQLETASKQSMKQSRKESRLNI